MNDTRSAPALSLSSLVVAAGGLVGGAFFLWIGGTRVINPGEFAWLMKSDWRINFLGWHLFRNEPWTMPPGAIHSYLSGEGTSIGLTDSVPLAAMLLKPFDAWLPTPFQYFGLWLLLCFVLQGVFGVLITRVFTSRVVLQLLAAALFVLVPTLLARVGHPALTAHFLLLWALWLYFSSAAGGRASIASQVGLGLCAALTHPYLAAMTLAILAALPLRDHTRQSALAFMAAVGATLVGWWAAGFFSGSSVEFAAGGLGLYSMNILSPITPLGWSTMLPDWPLAHDLQSYEGFQYLGAGNLALLLIAAIVCIVKRRDVGLGSVAPLAVICLLSAFYALSPRITLGADVIADWSHPLVERLAFFRASGRFFWPMTYFLIAAAIAVLSSTRVTLTVLILGAAVALQLVDQQRAHAERRVTSRSEAFHAWPRALVSPAWDAALPHYDAVVLIPASQCSGSPLQHEELAFVAGLHNASINSGLAARWDERRRREYCGQQEVAVFKGTVDERTLYVLAPGYVDRFRSAAQMRMACGVLDGLQVCVSAGSYEPWRHAAVLD